MNDMKCHTMFGYTVTKRLPLLAILTFLLFGMVQEGYGQRVYATGAIENGSGVTHSQHAISPLPGIIEPQAKPLARIANSGTNNSGSIRLSFEEDLSENEVVWLKVSEREIGAGGGEINIIAFNQSTPLANTTATYLTRSDGSTYYRVSASSVFNSVEIRVKGGSVLIIGSTKSSINIHFAFVEKNQTNCDTILGTTTSSSPGQINNPERAIDSNLDSYSVLETPLINLGGVMSQTIHLSRLSSIGDAATVTFSIPGHLRNDHGFLLRPSYL